jgi:pyocin large subunit-like protein
VTPRVGSRFVALCLVALVIWLGRRFESPPSATTPAGPPSATSAISAAAPTAVQPAGIAHPEIGFRDATLLSAHFHKHGAEFGARTEVEYLHLAQALRDRPSGGPILQSVRQDGVITRFDRSTGDFLAFERDLTVRTFFRPHDGERYYTRQLVRGLSE